MQNGINADKNYGLILIPETNVWQCHYSRIFGARIILNPQRAASHIDNETNFTRPVLVLCCELR
jgi:hypothetical protein